MLTTIGIVNLQQCYDLPDRNFFQGPTFGAGWQPWCTSIQPRVRFA